MLIHDSRTEINEDLQLVTFEPQWNTNVGCTSAIKSLEPKVQTHDTESDDCILMLARNCNCSIM